MRNAIWVHAALDDLGLAPSEFRVYAHLARWAGRGLAWPSIDSIAAVCGICRRTVIIALAALEGLGLMRVERRQGQSNRYRLAEVWEWAGENSEGRSAATELATPPTPGICCTPPISPTTTHPILPTTTPLISPTGGSTFNAPKLYPVIRSKELNPPSRSREGVQAKPSAGPGNKSRNAARSKRSQSSLSDSRKFWMLTKQIDCNAELMKALEKRGMRDDNDRFTFSNPADRDEYRRLRAERKALLEQTRPRMD